MSEGSHVPYVFSPFPIEFLSDKFLNDPIMLRFIICMMRRIFPYPRKIPLKNSRKPLSLEPFEFMYGRDAFSEEAGLSESNVRTRLSHLINQGYVEKVAEKSTTKYTVYRLVKEAFKQNNNQHFNQKDDQQISQQSSHKQKTKIQENKNIKETDVSKISLSVLQRDDYTVIDAYCNSHGMKIKQPCLERWIKKYPTEIILETLQLLLSQKNSIRNPEAWMETAFKGKFTEKNKNENCNRLFAEKFKVSCNWRELTVLKQYCRHELSGKDYYYSLPKENFQKFLRECYEQYREIGGENA